MAVTLTLLDALRGGPDGADSPVGAVENLVAAAEKEDPAAALATLAPNEARDAGDVYSDLKKRAGSFVRDDGGIAGVTVAATDLKLDSQDLGNGVARVTATSGRLSAAFAGTNVPSLLVPRSSSRTERQLGGERYEYVMVTRQDGGWFVSPLLTAVQQFVDFEELPQPDFSLLEGDDDDGPATKTPRALVTALTTAVSNRNVDGALALFSGSEIGALRAYRPAMQELVNRIDGTMQLDVRDLDIKEHEMDGDLVRLDIKHAGASATLRSDYSGEQADVRLNGFCVDASLQVNPDFRDCDTQMHRIFGIDSLFVVAERQGDNLRLAPIATAKAYIDAFFDEFSDAGVERMLGTFDKSAKNKLASGATVSGRLNDGGFATHTFQAHRRDLVAIDTDRAALVIAPNGARIAPAVCQNGTSLYSLAAAGSYRVVILGARFATGDYRVTAERVKPVRAQIPSIVSGNVGDGARVAVVGFQKPIEGVRFNTESAVTSTITRRDGDMSYNCGGERVGPEALFDADPDSRPDTLRSGSGSTDGYDGAGEQLLVVTGGRGATFRGTLAPVPLGG